MSSLSIQVSIARVTHLPPSPQASEARTFYAKATELSILRNRSDLDGAVTLFRRACELDPKFVQARAMLASALLTEFNHYKDPSVLSLAISTAREALVLDPECPQAHRVIAACDFKEGRSEEALAEYWRGIELDPRSPGCAMALGLCLRDMGRPEQAIPWLVRATRLEPSRGAFSGALGETLGVCGRDQEAELALRRAAELDPDRPDDQIDLAALRLWQRRFDEARVLSDEISKRFPGSRYVSSLAAWIDFSQGNLKEAAAKFEGLRKEKIYLTDWDFFGSINPASALAYIAMRDGSMERAQEFAQEAISIDRTLLEPNPLESTDST